MKHTHTLPHSPVVALSAPKSAPRTAAISERVVTSMILLIALAQGLVYLSLVPPWQHYDEPTHFEYAWLAAHTPHLPHEGDQQSPIRREIAASMAEHVFFQLAPELPAPNLASNDQAWIGISELGHPPAYYMLVSLPLRLASQLDVTTQLYIARAVSLLLLLVTIAASAGLLRDLTAAGNPLRWAVPLALALLPPFSDLMTAVNNDAGATAVFSLFLWAAARTIRLGMNWRRLVWLFGSALLAVLTKNTAAIALLLAPLACLLAFWVQRGARWRWLALGTLLMALALALVLLDWGDAATWYRGADLLSQNSGTQASSAAAPWGQHAIMLEIPAGAGARHIVNPLLPTDTASLTGRTITVGGWLWANRPATISGPRLMYQTAGMQMAQPVEHEVQLSTTPTFVAWTYDVPARTFLLSYTLYAGAPAAGEPPLQVFLDGALIANGAYPTSSAPTFDDANARAGNWAGQRFTNLVRNASGESSWPRLRPWADQLLGRYLHRSPAQFFAAVLDLPRVSSAMLPYMVRPAVDGMIGAFGWGNVRLANPIWLAIMGYLVLCALVGGGRWAFQTRAWPQRGLWPALLLLALAGLIVWANTIFRPLPLLGSIYVVPAARYTFPAISVTALVVVAGWWALWPRKLRLYATLGLIALLLALDSAAISTIATFYSVIPR